MNNNIPQETAQQISPENPPPPPARIQYPPGYRFMPTDTELVREYLVKKINNEPIPIAEINETYLRLISPKELTEKFPKLGDNEWYFFTPRDRKYPNGQRPDRGSESGYWKATGADKKVLYEDKIVGFRKALVFYEGKPQKGKKTNWIMHEYRVDGCQHQKETADDMRLDDWVLCRMYEKASRVMTNKRKNQEANADGAAGHAEEDEIDPSQAAVSSNDNESGDVVAIGGEELEHKYENFAVPENQYVDYQINSSSRNLGDWSTIDDSSLLLPSYEEEPVLINGQSSYNYYDDYGIVLDNNPVENKYAQAPAVGHPQQQQQAATFGYQQQQPATVGGYQQANDPNFLYDANSYRNPSKNTTTNFSAINNSYPNATNNTTTNFSAINNSYPTAINNTTTNFSDAINYSHSHIGGEGTKKFRYYKFN